MRKKIKYVDLNARQKETYNYQKISALLADYWYTTIKLSDDWQGADFIAMPFSWQEILRIQLKGRMTFDKKYIWKSLYICFENKENNVWYVYNHDELLNKILPQIENTKSWKDVWSYSFSWVGIKNKELLKSYLLAS